MKSSDSRFTGWFVAGTLALLLVTPVAAQRTTGQISGTVKDPSGAVLAGVTVSLNGPTIVGTRTTETNTSGFYRFLSLPPGRYQLTFSLDSFATQTRDQVRVSLGATTAEDATMRVGDVEETITVVANASVVDTSSNEVGTNYGRDWVENAPVGRSSFNELVAAAPGSLQAGEGEFDSRRTMVYGSSFDENLFQLDGADINDNFFNTQTALPNIDAIEEVEVLSLGAPAEYGNLVGAVYNIVTRQGSNQFRGDLNVFIQSDSLTDDNTSAEEDSGFPFERDDLLDYSAQLGGRLVKDRLWFFASYQHQEEGFSNVGNDPSFGTIHPEKDRYFGKLNLQLHPSHSLQLTYHQDDAYIPDPLDPNVAPSAAVASDGTTPTPGVGYSGVLTDNTTMEVRASGFYADIFLGPRDPGVPRDQARFYDLDSGFISGGHYYWYDLTTERTTVNAKVSHLADEFLGGGHEFRFGVQYNESEGSGIYGYNDLIYTYSYYGYDYAYGYNRVPFSYSGNTEALGVFVDDTWRVNDRLTLNLGVRYDRNKAFSRQQDELDENGRPTGVVFPAVTHYIWEYVSPRLGFNYQLTKDARTVLKGHVGRYHRAITTGEFANVIGPSIKPIFAGFYDLESNTFEELFQISDNSNLSVDPDYESPHTDQFILSLERQLADNLGAYLNLVYKRGRDFAAWQDFGGIYEEVVYIDDQGADTTGQAITLLSLLNDPEDLSFVITNRAEMDHEIKAASFGIVKPMANRWSLSASLTWLETEGRTPSSGGGSSLFQRGGLQFNNFGRDPNDFVNSDGRLRGDVPWQFKTQLVYQLPKGFMAAANVSVRSGGNRVRRLRVGFLTNRSTTILAQERGTSGRLPSKTLVDLRLQKDFELREGVSLGLFADIFNLLNDDAYEGTLSSIGTSESFDVPDDFILPRRVQLGAKLRF